MAGISGVHSVEGGSMFIDAPQRVLDKRLMGDESAHYDAMAWPYDLMPPELTDPGVTALVAEDIGGCIAIAQTTDRCLLTEDCELH